YGALRRPGEAQVEAGISKHSAASLFSDDAELIAWVVDLASRMFEAYPDSPDPLSEAAIALVDEIDLHLHPRWQREITAHLDRLFPNVQFIVTAHSPLVVQGAGVTNVAVLRRVDD